jgi:protein-L-isoaspartate(D-aspartate) O-methyltransferase
MDKRIEAARRWFAEELRHTAQVQSPGVIEAFATVKREQFAGPGPWRLLSPMRMTNYWTTASADPAHLYQARSNETPLRYA